jgi:hypothetical protein
MRAVLGDASLVVRTVCRWSALANTATPPLEQPPMTTSVAALRPSSSVREVEYHSSASASSSDQFVQ